MRSTTTATPATSRHVKPIPRASAHIHPAALQVLNRAREAEGVAQKLREESTQQRSELSLFRQVVRALRKDLQTSND